jgi:uncharacterized protein (DUF885 family)
MRSKLRFLAAVLLSGAAFFGSGRAADFPARYQAVIATKGQATEAARLHELFKVDWAINLEVSPELATYLGVPGYDMKWTDLSPAAIAERRTLPGQALRVLATIDRAQLSPGDQLNYDLFKRQAEEALEGTRFPLEYYQVTQLNGIQQDAAQIFSMMPNQTAGQLENQLARLQALPAVVDQTIALLEEGLKHGMTPPQITLRDVPEQVHAQIPEEAFQSPLLAGFNDLPPTVPGEAGTRLRAAAARTYAEQVRPAFQRLEQFITTKYVPGARQTIAASALPDGAAFYAWRIKTQTSTELTAQQIHEIGLAEVKRIRAEMEQIKDQTGFKGTMQEFFTYLQTDPKFFFTNKEDLMRAYRDIAKRADPQLAKLFKTLPRLPYGVIEVPAYAEKSQTTAYYNGGSPEAGRAGYFYANTYALNTRPKWEMQPLTLHEAVPGHHLQISLAQEMGDLPDFRKYGGYTAFVEGWGLYSESLGEEMGFYTDPYDKFGQLTFEIWRAIRLVTDTGMHALGWSRQQAIDYFKANSSKSEHDIVVEIDRYIVWPGQALAYKLGELKIKELRAYSTQELGTKFDVRLFHDEVLKNGAVPLSVLEANIKAWVAEQKKK